MTDDYFTPEQRQALEFNCPNWDFDSAMRLLKNPSSIPRVVYPLKAAESAPVSDGRVRFPAFGCGVV